MSRCLDKWTPPSSRWIGLSVNDNMLRNCTKQEFWNISGNIKYIQSDMEYLGRVTCNIMNEMGNLLAGPELDFSTLVLDLHPSLWIPPSSHFLWREITKYYLKGSTTESFIVTRLNYFFVTNRTHGKLHFLPCMNSTQHWASS